MNVRMKEIILSFMLILCLFAANGKVMPVYAAETKESKKELSGTVVQLDEDSDYKTENGKVINNDIHRFSISGPIKTTSNKNGMVSYGVDVDLDEKLSIDIEDTAATLIWKNDDSWESKDDGGKKIESTSLDDKIQSGAVIFQTSKDGQIWITDKQYTDIFDKTLTELQKSGKALYETTEAQLNNGCYYRIIVAYELQHRLDDTKGLFGRTKKNYETNRFMEVYDFYAYNVNSNLSEDLNTADAFKIGDMDYLVRCKDDEYSGSYAIDNSDPHSSWEIGKFYISGYTDKTEWNNDAKDPIFLKTVGDRITLWFNLEQDIDRCNGSDAIKVIEDSDGSDQAFNTPRMDFGRGMLIVKKIDERNGKTMQYYRNYLEASATVGANTKIDLLEEGDYEIALDYALEYQKTKVFGQSILPKTLHYRVYFKFSIRNGDSKVFVRNAETNEFIDNANIAENGFYLDLAKQQYLTLNLKREVMTNSLDGLVADTKFNGSAKEGRKYTDEGIYTITATNKYTSAETVKKVYVGDSDVLKAYTREGNKYTITELNELIAAGAYVEEDGTLILPKAVETETPEQETVEEPEQTEDLSEITVNSDIPEEVIETEENTEPVVIEETNATTGISIPAVVGIGIVLIAVFFFVITKARKNNSHKEGE